MRFEKALDQGLLLPGPVADWGRFSRLIEIGDDRYAVRHVDAFESGRWLRYDRNHWVDGFGMLADAQFGRREPRSRQWQVVEVANEEFEAAWEAAGRSPQWPLQVASAKMGRLGAVPVWLRLRGESASPP